MSRKPLPYMRLYVEDWDLDTRHLSPAEDGAYSRIVRHYWRTQQAPTEAAARNVTGLDAEQWAVSRAVLAAFFKIGADGRWKHGRIEAELKRVRAASAAARRNGKAGGKRSGEARRRSGIEAPASAPAQAPVKLRSTGEPTAALQSALRIEAAERAVVEALEARWAAERAALAGSES